MKKNNSLIRTQHSMEVLTKVSKAIFTSQLTINYLHDIRFTSYYNQKLKQSLNRTVKDLEEVEKKEFKLAYKQVEDETHELSELKSDLIDEIASLGPLHYEMLTTIIKDYKDNYKKLLKDEEYKVILKAEEELEDLEKAKEIEVINPQEVK